MYMWWALSAVEKKGLDAWNPRRIKTLRVYENFTQHQEHVKYTEDKSYEHN